MARPLLKKLSKFLYQALILIYCRLDNKKISKHISHHGEPLL